MIRRPPKSTHCISSAASDVYKRQVNTYICIPGRRQGLNYDVLTRIEMKEVDETKTYQLKAKKVRLLPRYA